MRPTGSGGSSSGASAGVAASFGGATSAGSSNPTGGADSSNLRGASALRFGCKRAGLRSIGSHVLRHTFCSHLAMRGAAPRAIQELVGHSTLSMTLRYMHLAPSALCEAIGLLNFGQPVVSAESAAV